MTKCECGCGGSTNALRFIRGHNMRGPKPWLRGREIPVETRKKISAATKGRRLSAEHRMKLSIVARSRPRSYYGDQRGSANRNWKGDNVGYIALHQWLYKRKEKTGKCSTCSHRGHTEWANISGVYWRDLDDFAEMCQSCHFEFDNDERYVL